MARFLFIAQQTLDTWMDQDKIGFDEDVMIIKADKRKFKLLEAVRFIKVEGGDSDTHGLIGKVKTNEQLGQLGAERYRDSVIYKDLAYKVQEGFIGEVLVAAMKKTEKVSVPKTDTAVYPGQASIVNDGAKTISKDIQVARTEPELQKVPMSPPALPVSPTSPPSSVLPKRRIDKTQKLDEQNQRVDGMSDEELLTRFLLDNL